MIYSFIQSLIHMHIHITRIYTYAVFSCMHAVENRAYFLMRKSLVSDLFEIPIICIRLPDPALHGNPILPLQNLTTRPSILPATPSVHVMTTSENTNIKHEIRKIFEKGPPLFLPHFWFALFGCRSYTVFISLNLQI